ncbi:MAG: archaetidylinositol phosphate synthase [Candidatus Bathyarchaeota archaeon]|jgi:archaetidylinositol phosphate synthase|nr:CDP-alcohol phosphatidyltransferase family protein [Candidatus Bathyarchaeota archaeon A05DMB-5]MDH7557354.1 archaetidylinositol phosphate synthase [Candidatus Bathyarchaeota archaeon]
MLTKLKQKIQQILTAEAKAAHKIGLTPNTVSAIGIILAFLSAATYAMWQNNPAYLLLATLLLLASGFCDALDGVIARLYQQTTIFGGFLDSLLDRYADAAVYMGIVVGGLCDALWGLIALVGSLLVSYSRARAEAAGIKMETIGLAERAERILIIAIATLIAFFWQPTTIINTSIILLAILTNLTVIQRSIYAYKKLKKKETN